MKAPAAGCYVHLPFCDRICPYCDFAVVLTDAARIERYMGALLREIDAAPRAPRPETIYLGGGTPSALSAGEISRVLAALFAHFDVAPGSVECTLEANPSRPAVDMAAWRHAGVTRLSVGVQSFDDGELQRLGRDHDAATARAYLAQASKAGFAGVNADLIAGAPGQDIASFARSVRELIGAGVDHASVYGLTIEAGTPYARWLARAPGDFPGDDATADLLEVADALLAAAGFEHYEISNFARPGRASRHNYGYWAQMDCHAFGMSAAGYHDGVRTRNARSFEGYCAALERGESPVVEEEGLDRRTRVGEAAMLALRTAQGIVYADFERRFGIDAGQAFARAAAKFPSDILITTDHGISLAPRGRLLANTVCAEFLDPDLDAVTTRQ